MEAQQDLEREGGVRRRGDKERQEEEGGLKFTGKKQILSSCCISSCNIN